MISFRNKRNIKSHISNNIFEDTCSSGTALYALSLVFYSSGGPILVEGNLFLGLLGGNGYRMAIKCTFKETTFPQLIVQKNYFVN